MSFVFPYRETAKDGKKENGMGPTYVGQERELRVCVRLEE